MQLIIDSPDLGKLFMHSFQQAEAKFINIQKTITELWGLYSWVCGSLCHLVQMVTAFKLDLSRDFSLASRFGPILTILKVKCTLFD